MDPLHSRTGHEISFALPESEYDSISNSVILKVRESILHHVYSDTQICLVTSSNRSGKSKFASSISKAFNPDVRYINLSSHDFLDETDFHDSSQNSESRNTHFSFIKHCIIDSISLGEKLIVIIDDADFLTLESFDELLDTAFNHTTYANRTCFIFLGHPNLASLVNQTMHCKQASVALLSLDMLTKSDLREYIEYCQVPASESVRLKLDSEAIDMIITQSSGSLYKATVLLEWGLLFCRQKNKSLLSADDMQEVIQHISDLCARDSKNYYLIYPQKEIDFSPATSPNPKIKFHHKDSEQHKPLFTLDNTIVHPGPRPRPPVLENVVALRESLKNSEDKSDSTMVKDIPHIPENHIRSSTSQKESEDSSGFHLFKPVLLLILLGILVFVSKDIPYNKTDDTLSSVVSQLTEYTRGKLLTAEQHVDTTSASLSDQSDSSLNLEAISIPSDSAEDNAINIPAESESSQESLKSDLDNNASNTGIKQTKISENTPSASPVNQAVVTRLLDLARKQFAENKLTTPEDDSAFNTYQIILELDSKNQKAIEGIFNIRDKYINWAEINVARGDLASAKRYYQRALTVSPDDYEITVRLLSLER